MWELLLLFWGPLLAAFGTEVLLCRLTRRRGQVLRLLPVCVMVLPAYGIWDAWAAQGFFWELGVLLWVGIGAAILLGLLAGWLLGRRNRKEDRT